MPKNTPGGGQGRVHSGMHGGYHVDPPPWPSPLCRCGHGQWQHVSTVGRCDQCICQAFVWQPDSGFDESGVHGGVVCVYAAMPKLFTPRWKWRLESDPKWFVRGGPGYTVDDSPETIALNLSDFGQASPTEPEEIPTEPEEIEW